MHPRQRSIGRQKAAALARTHWWVGRTPREIAKFQLLTVELCLPFKIFHRTLEAALGRPVWIHEFGFEVGALIEELFGERDAPAPHEMLNLLPLEKTFGVFVEEPPF